MIASAPVVEEICALYVDMGTTNTRVWLVQGSHIVARASRNLGVRDAARAGSNSPIRHALKELVEEVISDERFPKYIAAAGMISSPLGLMEVPHAPAPAGVAELAAASRWVQFPEITELPILLVTGVRCGPKNPSAHEVNSTDVMRAEETLCVGLNAQGLISPPAVILNLGSHWKAIQIDEQGRIASSITSLSGELIHAAQTHTILASSLPQARPTELSPDWLERGMREQRRSGLARASFCVRLLDLAGHGTPAHRLAFLCGAVIASDLDALSVRGLLSKGAHVVIVGSSAIAEAWRSALLQAQLNATVLSGEDSERAFLTGLHCILTRALDARKISAAC